MQIPRLISTLVLFLVGRRISVVAVQRQAIERVPGAPRARLALDEAPRASEPLPLLLNTTKLSLNPPSLINNVFDIQCNDRLGTFDSPVDCDSALAMIRGGPQILTFADRQTHAIRSWMYPLPWRWMGGNSPGPCPAVRKAHSSG